MLQYDQQKINLETTLGTMSPIFKDSNKANINFKDLLSHYAGLAAGIPFYKANGQFEISFGSFFLEKYLKISKRLWTVFYQK
jgi:CubicO group peptidase (beta-lactamase class C family)